MSSNFGQFVIVWPRPPQLAQPLTVPSAFAFGSSISNRKGGIRCLASIRRYFRSSKVSCGVCMFTKVVAIPVLPERPVRPTVKEKIDKLSVLYSYDFGKNNWKRRG